MKRKYLIAFLVSVLLLVGSEYFFLNELTRMQRVSILLITTIGALAAIIFIILTMKRSEKDNK